MSDVGPEVVDTKTYTVTVRFAVDAESDEHLQTAQGIQDEITSLLTWLDANVESVTVEQEEKTR